MKPAAFLFFTLTMLSLYFCSNSEVQQKPMPATPQTDSLPPATGKGIKTIHVFVALCDNLYQGIVPVSKAIGNGQDADNNLYWGCSYGVSTYFKRKASDWKLVQTRKNLSPLILERIIFKHKSQDVYLLADAYDGRYIRQATIDFLNAASGRDVQSETIENKLIHFGGASRLTAYIGHDGLMDFSLPPLETATDTSERQAVILACYSKKYFSPHLERTGAEPLLWTTGLMAPEAYILHDAIHAWLENSSEEQVRQAAAGAYHRYQKCGLKAARRLLVSGW